MTSQSARFDDLARMPGSDLDAVFAAGGPPDIAALAGFEFRGYNQPRSTAVLGIRKFIKCFWLDRAGQAFGCNTPAAQNGLDGAWLARPSDDKPKRYAFFLVEPAAAGAADLPSKGAVLLDYGRGGNRGYDVSRTIRDYVVRVEPGSDDVLLGKAHIIVAGIRLYSSYFLLERFRPLPDAKALAAREARGKPAPRSTAP